MAKTIQLTKEDERLIDNMTENLTDLGNMRRFIEQTNGNLLFLYEMGKWIYWTGKVWKIDPSGKRVAEMVEETIRSIYKEAAECDDKKDREALADYALKSESEHKIRNTQKLAQTRLSIAMDEMDRDPWLLNCLNGTINLQTGELLEHDKSHRISKIIPVEFNIEANCPEWINFLNLIMDGDQDMLIFLQRAIGYSLTGHTDERCVFILYGQGRNGKSTFTENIANLLPGYAMKTPSETLLIKKWGEGIPSDIARLKGARFVYASETGQGRRLNESRIKELTGDKDTLVARFLHQDYFEYVPSFKLWLHTNHRPTIRGTDQAIWDRIKLVPFEVRITEDKSKPRREIDEIFKAEQSGILAWAVKGCLDWQHDGLITPEAVKRGTDEYKEESDSLKEFFDECCITEQSAKVEKRQIFEVYVNWAKACGERFLLNKNKFGASLKQRGIGESRETSGDRRSYWIGIGLTAQ